MGGVEAAGAACQRPGAGMSAQLPTEQQASKLGHRGARNWRGGPISGARNQHQAAATGSWAGGKHHCIGGGAGRKAAARAGELCGTSAALCGPQCQWSNPCMGVERLVDGVGWRRVGGVERRAGACMITGRRPGAGCWQATSACLPAAQAVAHVRRPPAKRGPRQPEGAYACCHLCLLQHSPPTCQLPIASHTAARPAKGADVPPHTGSRARLHTHTHSQTAMEYCCVPAPSAFRRRPPQGPAG